MLLPFRINGVMQNEEQEVISKINEDGKGGKEFCLRDLLLLQSEIIKIKAIFFRYDTLNNAGKL